MKGVVKFFNRDKNFGFVTGDDNKDYFVHGSAVEGNIRDGDAVTFEPMEGDRGLKAEGVKRDSGSSDAKPAASPAEDVTEDVDED